MPVLLFEDRRGWQALRRSFRLVRGRWWATFLLLVVGTVLTAIVTLPLVPVEAAGHQVAGDSVAGSALLRVLVDGASAIVITPMYASLLLLVYVDARGRTDLAPPPAPTDPAVPYAPRAERPPQSPPPT